MRSHDPVRRVRFALALLVLAVVGPLVHMVTAQPGVRLALTASLAEDHSIRIDRFTSLTAEIDRVQRAGHTYSDKAPGQPVMAVPVYWVGRAAGLDTASHKRLDENLTLWWVSFWSAAVPGALLVVLMYDAAARFNRRGAVPAALCTFFGTMLMVFSSQLFGHILGALLAYSAWLVVSDTDDPSSQRLALCGLLLGLAVATEYPTALVIPVVLGGAWWRGARARLGWLIAAAVPPALLLAGYQWAAFGHPLRSSYAEKATAPGSALEFGLPDPGTLAKVLVGTRGLIWLPIVAVAVVAAIMVLRSRDLPGRHHAAAGLVVLTLFVLLQSSWPNPWGGEVSFPRYTVTAMPFLAVPLAVAWERLRLWALAAAALGFLRVLPATTVVVFQPHGADFVDWYRYALGEYGRVPTVFEIATGPIGVTVWLALVAGAALWLRSADRATRAQSIRAR